MGEIFDCKPMTMAIRQLTSSVAKRIYLGMAVVVLAFSLFDNVLMPLYVNQGGTLQVPDVVGLPFEQAHRLLDSLDLEARQGYIRSDPNHPEGTVLQQNPIAFSAVKPGRRIYLTLSGGESIVEVPILKGRSVRDARFKLETRGLRLGTVRYKTSREFPENTIIEQTVPSGTKIRQGSQISVVVSKGSNVNRIAVPRLTGKSLPEAERILKRRNLKLGQITYQGSSEFLPNTVIDQFPRSGDIVNIGRAVDLFVVQVATEN
ncbi:MAG: PASTA domain-containing protein [Bacteroidota bacterium]